jgi:hypothetical protein
MKKFYVLLAILLIGKFSSAQVIFEETFQSGTMPSTFTLINDANTVATNIATLFPNAWVVIKDVEDTTNKVAASTSWFTAVAAADRWLITPAIAVTANKSLTWRGVAVDGSYRDGYSVKLSTTGTAKANFTNTLFTVAQEDSTWHDRSVSLSAYSGQNVYIAFVENSTDQFILYIDNIKVASTGVGIDDVTSENASFNVYPNPVKNELNITSNTSLKNIKIVNTVGQEILNENVSGNHYKINTSSYIKGIYFVQIESEKGKTTKKFVVSE